MFMGPRNWLLGMNSASLCSLAGRYENPIPPRCLAPIDFLKIPAQGSLLYICSKDAETVGGLAWLLNSPLILLTSVWRGLIHAIGFSFFQDAALTWRTGSKNTLEVSTQRKIGINHIHDWRLRNILFLHCNVLFRSPSPILTSTWKQKILQYIFLSCFYASLVTYIGLEKHLDLY